MDNKVFETVQYYGELADIFKKELKNKPLIYRLTGQKSRIYFTKADENAPVTVYNSGTTLIRNYKDEGGEEAIHKWKVNLINAGKDPAKELKTRQDYGTLLHIVYGKILMGEKTNFKNLKNFIIDCHRDSRLPKEYVTLLAASHLREFKKDVASFITWIKEYEVEPLAVELMLKSDKYRVATALDLIAYVKVMEEGYHGEVYKTSNKARGITKGDPKLSKAPVRKLVIVDFKSGKKGFYEKNIIQLLLSRKIFEENFPNIKVDGIFNLAPNAWTVNPTYKFYDQERDTEQTNYLIGLQENIFQRGLYEFENKLSKKRELVLSGEIDIKNVGGEMVSELTLEEVANKYFIDTYVVNRTVFQELLEEQGITSEELLVSFLNNQNESYLQELASGIGVSYSGKKELITILKDKFNNGEKEA